MLATFVMSVPAIATSDWLASKYGSLKSTVSARSGRIEICAMCAVERLLAGLEGERELGVLDPVDLVIGEAEGLCATA